MINEKDIQDRVNRRLSGLAASEQRRMRIRTAINAEREEAQPMKRTISKTLVFAIVAVMLIATVAIAEHFNLFNFFSSQGREVGKVKADCLFVYKLTCLLNMGAKHCTKTCL